MKKSTAIQIIADWLSAERSGVGITSQMDIENATELLEIIENELDMMPPPLNHDDYRWEEE